MNRIREAIDLINSWDKDDRAGYFEAMECLIKVRDLLREEQENPYPLARVVMDCRCSHCRWLIAEARKPAPTAGAATPAREG